MRYKKGVVIITFAFVIISIIVIIPSFFLKNEIVKNVLLSVGFAVFGGSFVSFFVGYTDYLEYRKDILTKTFYEYLYIDNHFQKFIYSNEVINEEIFVNILAMLEDELIKINDKIKELYDSDFPIRFSNYLRKGYKRIGIERSGENGDHQNRPAGRSGFSRAEKGGGAGSGAPARGGPGGGQGPV